MHLQRFLKTAVQNKLAGYRMRQAHQNVVCKNWAPLVDICL